MEAATRSFLSFSRARKYGNDASLIFCFDIFIFPVDCCRKSMDMLCGCWLDVDEFGFNSMGDVKSLKSLNAAGNVSAKSLLSLLFSIPESLADILSILSNPFDLRWFVYFFFSQKTNTIWHWQLSCSENENVWYHGGRNTLRLRTSCDVHISFRNCQFVLNISLKANLAYTHNGHQRTVANFTTI